MSSITTISPSLVAYAVLFGFPAVIGVLCYRFDAYKAVCLSILIGFLFLPVGLELDLPFIPPLDKTSIVILSLCFCLFVSGRNFITLPRNSLLLLLLLGFLLSPFITLWGNGHQLVMGNVVRPPYGVYDAFSELILRLFFIIPFCLGVTYGAAEGSLNRLYVWIVGAALIYSLPILLEVRISPQLHSYLYGYFPHSFLQQIRYGGFRPVVFIGHGITVAFFVFVAVSSLVLMQQRLGTKSALIKLTMGIYLLFVLILCKSITSLVLAIVFFGVVFTLPLGIVRIFTRSICVLLLLYPLVSFLIPKFLFNIGDFIYQYDPDRAQSFLYRLDQEQQLMTHIGEKILIGWGTWGRMRFEHSVIDSGWLLTLGQFGVFGYLSLYGFLTAVIFRGLKSAALTNNRFHSRTMTLSCFLLSLMLFDQLINTSATSSALYLLMFGVVLARGNFILFHAR